MISETMSRGVASVCKHQPQLILRDVCLAIWCHWSALAIAVVYVSDLLIWGKVRSEKYQVWGGIKEAKNGAVQDTAPLERK